MSQLVRTGLSPLLVLGGHSILRFVVVRLVQHDGIGGDSGASASARLDGEGKEACCKAAKDGGGEDGGCP